MKKAKELFLLIIIIFSAILLLQDLKIQQYKTKNQQLNSQLDSIYNESFDTKYIKKCIDNVNNLYNDSMHRVYFIRSCVREFATLNDIRIQNCFEFNYFDKNSSEFCGFARTTLMVKQLSQNNVTNVTFFKKLKARRKTI